MVSTPLDRLLRPRSLAIVGATDRPGYGRRLLQNVLDGGYTGAIHPVSRSRSQVLGLPAVASLDDVDGRIDVVLVVVPAAHVPDIVRQCGRLDVGAMVVISAGFGEAGVEGRRLRDALQAAAAETGLLVLGPNGNGYACASADLWATTFSGLRPERAAPVLPAVLLSQSGGTAFGAGHERAQDLGFTFDAVFSMGNEEVISSEQLAEQLLDAETEVVALVCEEFHDGPALLRAARIARERNRSIVVLKVGRSEAGRAAAATHTAALAGDDAVIDGVLRQHGVVRVDDVDELVQAVRYLATAPRPRGHRGIVLSHSGGLAALAADALGTQGFELPPLPDAVAARLDELLGDTGGRSNPVDVTMALRDPVVSDIVTALTGADADFMQVITAGDAALPERVAAGIEASGTDLPAHLVWASGLRTGGDLEPLDASPLPWFTGATIAARVLGRIRDAARATAPAVPDGIRSRVPAVTLDEVESKGRLAGVGVDVPPALVARDREELLERAHEIPRPWALKIASPHVLHKAAAGLMALGLQDTDRLRCSVDRIQSAAATAGVTDGRWLLEHQADVRGELYLGCTLDPHLGAVVGVGPGGRDVELLRHVVWSTCPVTPDAVAALFSDDEGLRRWAEHAGLCDADVVAVAEVAARVSDWFLADGDLQEVEINPLAVTSVDGDVLALDAVLRLSEAAGTTTATERIGVAGG